VANCVAVAALAMLSSLYLPRLATFLFVIGGVSAVALANLMSASGIALGMLFGVLDEIGPPILSGIVLALSGWSGQPPDGAEALNVAVRMAIWMGGSVSSLLFLFDHRELTNYEPR
jgi:glycerol uptake facilitator-like aquaporin